MTSENKLKICRYWIISGFFIFMGCQSTFDGKEGAHLPPSDKIYTFLHEQNYAEYLQASLPETYGIAVYADMYGSVSFNTHDNSIQSIEQLLASLDEPLLVMLQLTNSHLKKIVDGNADIEINELTRKFKNYNHDIYLAIGHEVNNPRYLLVSSLYIQAYRMLVDRFTENKVNNVAYIWHIIGVVPKKNLGAPIVRLESYYPGDQYVDWIGLSMYDIIPAHFGETSYFEAPMYDKVSTFASEHGLPIFICESSPTSLTNDFAHSGDFLWSYWYEPFFEFIKNNNVRAITHKFYSFEDEVVLKKWREKLRQPEFVLDGT